MEYVKKQSASVESWHTLSQLHAICVTGAFIHRQDGMTKSKT